MVILQWTSTQELNLIVDADGRHHFIDRILLGNPAKNMQMRFISIATTIVFVLG